MGIILQAGKIYNSVEGPVLALCCGFSPDDVELALIPEGFQCHAIVGFAARLHQPCCVGHWVDALAGKLQMIELHKLHLVPLVADADYMRHAPSAEAIEKYAHRQFEVTHVDQQVRDVIPDEAFSPLVLHLAKHFGHRLVIRRFKMPWRSEDILSMYDAELTMLHFPMHRQYSEADMGICFASMLKPEQMVGEVPVRIRYERDSNTVSFSLVG